MKVTKYRFSKTGRYYYSPIVSLGHDENSFCARHLGVSVEVFRKIAYKFNATKDGVAEQIVFDEEHCSKLIRFLNEKLDDTIENKIKFSLILNTENKMALYANDMVLLWEDICDHLFESSKLYRDRKLLKKFNSVSIGYYAGDEKDAEAFKRYLQHLEEKLKLPQKDVIEV